MRALLVHLVGKDTEGNVFDSTKGEVAKALYGKEGPIVVFVGLDKVVPGLEKYLERAEVGSEKEIELQPSEAFGFRKAELIKTYPISQFKKSNIVPRVGDVLEFDDGVSKRRGIVRSVGSGRVMIDFNHPLAGKKVIYWVKVEKELDDKEKAEELKGRFPHLIEDISVNGEVVVKVKDEAVPNLEALLLLSPVKAMLEAVFGKKAYFEIDKEKVAKALGGEVKEGKVVAEVDEKLKEVINNLFKEPLL